MGHLISIVVPMGARPFSEIKQILEDVDIVLHAESFLPQNIIYTKLSYSTKNPDCLQSGSMMLVVGPANIASVVEAKDISGVYVIDDKSAIYDKLYYLIENSEAIVSRAKLINNVAKERFNLSKIRNGIRNDFYNLLNS